MARFLCFAYSLACYATFLFSFAALAVFLLNINDMRGPPMDDWPVAALIDIAMIGCFGLTHSIMARSWFKRLWTRVIPHPIERSTYVLQSSLFLLLIVFQWRPIPAPIWQVEALGSALFYTIFVLGAGIVVLSTFLLGHLDFLGLAQTLRPLSGDKSQPVEVLKTPLLYRIVRHPLQLGLLLMFFATPNMTTGHLIFAASMTLYMLIGLHFEELALVRTFGDSYRVYQRSVPRLLPLPRFSRNAAPVERWRL